MLRKKREASRSENDSARERECVCVCTCLCGVCVIKEEREEMKKIRRRMCEREKMAAVGVCLH